MSTLNWLQNDLELLNVNMNYICNELETLLQTNEPDARVAQDENTFVQNVQDANEIMGAATCYTNYMALAGDACTFAAPPTYFNHYNEPQQLLSANYYSVNLQQPPAPPMQMPLTAEPAPAVMHFQCAPRDAPPLSNISSPPKFEFHYLRSQSFNKSTCNSEPVPLITTAAVHSQELRSLQHSSRAGHQTAGRKNQFHKYNHKGSRNFLDDIDIDKLEINIEDFAPASDLELQNPLLRIFDLLHKLNYYLHDEFPYGPKIIIDNKEFPAEPKPLPKTMNVQHQLKHAIRNCTIFMCDKERILNANKLNDRQLYAECEKSLNVLRKLFGQLEMYKRVEMDHKRGEFLTSDTKAQAQRLELLLQQLNDKVRECNLYIHVFNWAMEQKCKGVADEPAADFITKLPDCDNAERDDGGEDDKNNKQLNAHGDAIAPTGLHFPIRYIGC